MLNFTINLRQLMHCASYKLYNRPNLSTGLLEAPGHLVVSEQRQTIILTWEEPPTLDLTDIDPDIDPYTVYITNLNTSQSLSVNVTETKYTFTGLLGETVLNPCSFYQFSVSAWNVVGEGGMSVPAEGHFIDGKYIATYFRESIC